MTPRGVQVLGIMAFAFCLQLGCKGGGGSEASSGITPLGISELAQLKTDLGWGAGGDARANSVLVQGAFVVTSDFGGDLGTRARLSVPVSLLSSDNMELVLARVDPFTAEDGALAARLVAPATFDPSTGEVTIFGDEAAAILDAEERISRAAGNQLGTYLLLGARGNQAPWLISGVTVLYRAGDSFDAGAVWPGATIGLSTSPLLARSGGKGHFFTATFVEGGVVAWAERTGKATPPAGTPAVATAFLLSPGDQTRMAADNAARATAFGTTPERLAQDLVLQGKAASGNRTDARLSFDSPRPGKVFALRDDRDPPARPTIDVPAEALPPPGSSIFRVDRDDAPQLDLGCSGFDRRGNVLDFRRVPSEIDDNAGTPGWRAGGDVRYAYDAATAIFGAPDPSAYLDNIPGYCVISTGASQVAAANGDPSYKPGPAGAGFSSWVAQHVLVPQAARSLRVRFAIFTQEYPHFVQRDATDRIFVGFDERAAPLAVRSLKDFGDRWRPVGGAIPGNLWGIESSPSAAPGGFGGYLEPETLCADLNATRDPGKELTLRVGVSDGGDAFFDTALLIDAIYFANTGC